MDQECIVAARDIFEYYQTVETCILLGKKKRSISEKDDIVMKISDIKIVQRLTSLDYVFEFLQVMVGGEPIPDVQQFFRHLHPPTRNE